MRLLPFALLNPKIDLDSLQSIARFSGHITHHHAEVNKACDLYIQAAAQILYTGKLMSADSVIYHKAKEITHFGTGWTALSCVQMAIWAFHHAKDFEELLTLSICHEGDSDSVAAVAGSLWGLAGRPGCEKYINRLEQQPAIDRLLARWEISGAGRILL